MHAATVSRNGGISRRNFIGLAAGGIAAAAWALRARPVSAAPASQVALCQSDSRAGNILEVLKHIEPQIRAGLATKKRIIIKPNLVKTDNQLCATHAECLEGIFEFLRPVTDMEITVAETSANAATVEGYDNYGFPAVTQKYGVQLRDLDDLAFERVFLVNERYHAAPVRYSTFLQDPEAFVISTAPFKTHDRAVVTLGIKNLTVGGILKDKGYRWGAGSKGTSDKHLVHGGPENQGIHYNLFSLTQRLRPHLTLLDGFQGMEHNGPISGTPVDHHVAVASTDWVAADSVGAQLMGFDPHKIGYMVFCAQAGMGAIDADQMEILGPPISELARSYQPHDAIEKQYGWM